MRRFLRLLPIVALSLLVAPRALADTFSDPKGSFEIDIPAKPGQKVCILFPVDRVNGKDCEKIDLDAVVFGAGRSDSTLIGEAVIMDEGKPLVFIVQRQDRTSTPRPDQYDAMLDDLTGQSSTDRGPKPFEHGRRMAQVGAMTVPEVDLSFPAGGITLRAMVALIPVNDGAFVVAILAPNRFPVTAGEAFTRALQSVSVEAPTLDKPRPEPKKVNTSWILPVVLGGAGFILAIVLVVFLVRRRRARREREAIAAAEAERMKGISVVGSGPLGSAYAKRP
ncbi:MAG: hypothetical protein U0414_34015 [Polyangiaceae bacterium]